MEPDIDRLADILDLLAGHSERISNIEAHLKLPPVIDENRCPCPIIHGEDTIHEDV